MANPTKVKVNSKEKIILHPRNKFREQYDFKALTKTCPELAAIVRINEFNVESIDFFNPKAVKTLNQALLKHVYGITHWDIPRDFLCPPVPGRSDYVHYAADILASANQDNIPRGKKINCLDIGVGANCIYPIIGHREYEWSFVGSEIDPIAMNNAKSIIETNKGIKGAIEIRKQNNPKDILKGVILKNEHFDLVLCNPPFYTSLAEAQGLSKRKVTNLKKTETTETVMNFGGQKNELWCEGGEARFIEKMVIQSKEFEYKCFWFTTLVAKENHLKRPYELLKKLGATEVRTIPMGQGNKVSRMLAWTFLVPENQQIWIKERWTSK